MGWWYGWTTRRKTLLNGSRWRQFQTVSSCSSSDCSPPRTGSAGVIAVRAARLVTEARSSSTLSETSGCGQSKSTTTMPGPAASLKDRTFSPRRVGRLAALGNCAACLGRQRAAPAHGHRRTAPIQLGRACFFRVSFSRVVKNMEEVVAELG